MSKPVAVVTCVFAWLAFACSLVSLTVEVLNYFGAVEE